MECFLNQSHSSGASSLFNFVCVSFLFFGLFRSLVSCCYFSLKFWSSSSIYYIFWVSHCHCLRGRGLIWKGEKGVPLIFFLIHIRLEVLSFIGFRAHWLVLATIVMSQLSYLILCYSCGAGKTKDFIMLAKTAATQTIRLNHRDIGAFTITLWLVKWDVWAVSKYCLFLLLLWWRQKLPVTVTKSWVVCQNHRIVLIVKEL